jgi:dihydroxyacetone kinase-like protein
MKKTINRPDQAVYEMLDGPVAANPGRLKLVREKKIVLRADAPVRRKVAVLTGSGSGHEPDQVLNVGRGME